MQNTETDIVRIDTDLACGLSADEVNLRIAQNATNKVKNKKSKSYLRILYDNFCTFFNLLCFICFFVLLSVASSTAISNFVFVFIFVANSVIGTVQEIRAKRTVEKLSLVGAPTARVLRNGEFFDIAISDIVLDDIVELSVGAQIPADCIVKSGTVEVNEALLTGESVPIRKTVGDKLLSGSFIVGGKCLALCDKVGENSYVQQLTEKAKTYQKTNSTLLNSLNAIIKTVSIMIIPVVIGSGIVNYNASAATGELNIPEVVVGTCSVVIGMIPCGMFFLTTLSLAVGIIKLGRMNTLVQDMYSIEMLARVNVLCLDKTGTITDGNLKVRKIIPLCDCPDEKSAAREGNTDTEDILAELVTMESLLGEENQTAKAITDYGANITVKEKTVKFKLPFSSARKYAMISYDDGTYVLGAPDFVLDKIPDDIYAAIETETSVGARVVLLAKSPLQATDETLPDKMLSVALVVIEDNVRDEAIEAINWFQGSDVEIKVISGDNPLTVSEISRRAGIKNYEKYIDVHGMTDEELIAAAQKYTVFGRVSPEQKATLITALKDKKHTVGMTGDGVNDILAMKEADCSVTVASGSAAARSLAHIVLVDNNFNTLPQAVKEGRRVVNNIQRSASLYLMKTVFTFVFALISIFTMSHYPFTTGMMLLMEFFIIGIPSVTLSLEPNSERIKGNFIKYVLLHALPGATVLIINAVVIKLLNTSTAFYMNDDVYMTMSAVTLTTGGWVFLTVLCYPYTKYRTILVAFISLVALGACVTILTTSVLSGFFGLVPLLPISDNIRLFGLIGGLIVVDYLIIITIKFIFKT